MLQKLNNTKVVVYEEVIRNGSLGSLILDAINRLKLNIEVKILAINDHYVEQGDIESVKRTSLRFKFSN